MIRSGMNRRTVQATNANDVSSRSHAIVTLTLYQQSNHK